MYRLIVKFAVLNLSCAAGILIGSSCARGGRYCRPEFPRNYGPLHNTYHAYEKDTPPPTPTTKGPPPADTFEFLAHQLYLAESAIHNFCRDNSHVIKETYDKDHYILEYTLRDKLLDEVSVKIKHKVIYVTVLKDGTITFRDLRILPNIVDTVRAYWILGNDKLVIHIPYSVQFTTTTAIQCSDMNDTTVTVPNAFNYREGGTRQELKLSNPASTSQHNPDNSNNGGDQQGMATNSLDDALAVIFAGNNGYAANIDVRNHQI